MWFRATLNFRKVNHEIIRLSVSSKASVSWEQNDLSIGNFGMAQTVNLLQMALVISNDFQMAI